MDILEESENIKIPDPKIKKGPQILYISIVGCTFAVLTAIFLFFPRSKYSELEKRDLASIPHHSELLKNPEKYTSDISSWFSDTEPYRDFFMTMSMGLRDAMRLKIGSDDEVFSFKPASTSIGDNNYSALATPEAQGNPLADENAKIANAGIVVVGTGKNVRALMSFGGTEKSMQPFIDLLNSYLETFPDINLYAMPIPSAAEFYLPKAAEKASKPQKLPLDWFQKNLSPKIKYVDVYSHLAGHTHEDIFLRTDHHWAPLGAFYAARALAASANVPFRDLTHYDTHTIHDYVGSMYGYSKDISVKNAPEDFIYYTPRNAGERSYFTTYTLDKDFQITGERGPYESNFFVKFNDGAGGAYCTYMGGDTHIVKITTKAPNQRRLMIIKDSYGNPVPSFLFYSFSEIHIVDFRYFTKNMKQYVKDNKITDIAMVFNIFATCTPTTMLKVKNFLTQKPGVPEHATSSKNNNESQAGKKTSENKSVVNEDKSVNNTASDSKLQKESKIQESPQLLESPKTEIESSQTSDE